MINEAFRLLRVFGDIKAKELAIKVGISPNYLSEIESGKKKPTLKIIEKYCEVFNLRTSQVLSLSEELEKIKDRRDIAKKLVTLLKWTEDEQS